MFQWDKSLKSLDVTVTGVSSLHRSMRDVQLALPGLPAQEATAYLCQYQSGQGVATVAAFHLHSSNRLAFYRDTLKEVPAGQAEGMLDQGLVFVESMGFLMTDLDLHLLSEADRMLLWKSLPLQDGVVKAEPSTMPPAPAAQVQPRPDSEKKSVAVPVETPVPTVEKPVPVPDKTEPVEVPATQEKVAANGEGVDDLLAAVEALRNRRPGVGSRKKAPTPEELKLRRQGLRETLGRILASL